MSVIKDFLKKKKTDINFGRAGPGHKLNEQPSSCNESKSSPGEAAIKRIEGKQMAKKNTLENILQQERNKIKEEYKQKEQMELRQKEENTRKQEENQLDDKQLFSCPSIGLNDSLPPKQLVSKIREYIELNFSQDAILRNALKIKNCNFSHENNNNINECIQTLELILSNLSKSSDEKFRKIRKIKIEKKILSLEGGEDFLTSIGFEPSEEWLVLRGDAENDFSYYLDVLRGSRQFDVILDRHLITIDENVKKEKQSVDDNFFKVTADDIKYQQQELTANREKEEMLRTKAMRQQEVEQKKSKSKYTRLRFRFPSGVQREATFRTTETLEDIKVFLFQFDSLNEFEIQFGTKTFSSQEYKNSIKELDLVPSASLIVKLK